MLELDHTLREIPSGGLETQHTFDAAARKALADRLGIVAVDALSVAYDILPAGADGFDASGTIRARVQQTCGVTLEPVGQSMEEPFEIAYRLSARLPPEAASGGEIEVDPLSGDEPEPIRGNRIALGPIIEQVVASALDPFPRAPDAALDVSQAGTPPVEDAKEASPFASLAKLKAGDDS
ncbi:MAG: DUF177 domain-containing protein [Pseudomonadota bacterium]